MAKVNRSGEMIVRIKFDDKPALAIAKPLDHQWTVINASGDVVGYLHCDLDECLYKAILRYDINCQVLDLPIPVLQFESIRQEIVKENQQKESLEEILFAPNPVFNH